MAIAESKISRPNVTSTTKMADVVSKSDFNPVSKSDFNPVSKCDGPMPTSVYVGAFNPIMSIAERNAMIYPNDDITMEEIMAECKAVRQELYEKNTPTLSRSEGRLFVRIGNSSKGSISCIWGR